MTNIWKEIGLAHPRAWKLLPWLVNGTLAGVELAQIEAHLNDCRQCRNELALQRSIYARMNAHDAPGPPLEQGLARLMRDIDERHRPMPLASRPPRRAILGQRRAAIFYGLAALLLFETGGLAVLASRLETASRLPATYRTLSAPDVQASRATIRLVVDDAMRIKQLQALLVPLHLQIVAGPTQGGVYSLAPASQPGDTERQIAALRGAPGVRFAEPLDVGRNAQ